MKLRQKLRPVILTKCAKLNYSYIENSASWDMISRLTKEPEKQAALGLTALSDLSAILVNAIGVMAYVAIAAKWAVFVILAFTIPLIYFSVKGGKAKYQVSREVSLIERKYNYLREILLERDYVDERTMFGYSEKINAKAYKEYEKTYKVRVKTAILWHVKTKIGSILNACSGLAVILILLKPTLSGSISVGLFIAVINGVFSLTGYLSWGLSSNVDVLFHTGEFTKDLQELMSFSETPEALTEPGPMDAVESIEFINVSFRYPGTEQYILRELSFKLERGRHYAFVGANGAGKTTTVKLLTGLYRDYTGRILINGREFVLLAFGAQIMGQVLNLGCFAASQPLKIKVKGALDYKIHEKATRLRALDFEQPDTLNCIKKAKGGADSALLFYTSISTLVFFYGPYILALGVYFYWLNPPLLLALPFIIVPLLMAQLLKSRI